MDWSVVNNDNFTVLVGGGSRHRSVSMGTVTFKMNERVEQQICSTLKFCVKLPHSSEETIRMIQKTAAMGNW